MIRTDWTWRVLAALMAVALLVVACTSDDAPPSEAEGRGEPTEEPGDGEAADDDEDGEDEDEGDEEPVPLEAEIEEIAEQVSVLRELSLEDPVDTEVVGPEELAEIVTERSTDAEAMERTAAAERVLVSLRHLPPDADLQAIYDDLLTSSVVGLYSPEDSVAYVSSEAEPLGPAAAGVAAHELLHALQDQHFDLSRLDDLPDDDGDAVLAFMSVVEGDAVIIEEEWSLNHQSEEERAEAEEEQLASAEEQAQQLQEAPPYIVESFIFPYVVGERFVSALIGERGYEAIDETLEDPPTTTLEILDPERFLEGFTPTQVRAGSAPGQDWAPLFSSTFGAFDLLALFGAASGTEAAQGSTAWPAWRGGALEAWERGDEIVVAAAWAFEDDERAATVCEALPYWYEEVAEGTEAGGVWRSDRDVFALSCEGSEVRLALGPDRDTAEAAATLD